MRIQVAEKLATLPNFRDLGGLVARSGREVKRGQVYRCGSLHRWDDGHVDVCRPLGVRTLIDLRGTTEAEAFPAPAAQLGAAYVNIPFPTDGVPRSSAHLTLAHSYLAMAELSAPSICELLLTLSDPEHLPAVLFCAAGKDRTGVATALLLGALNVSDEQIVADYALSGTIDPVSLGSGYAQRFATLPTEYRRSEPETMRTFLEILHAQHGSVRTFVARLGCRASTLAALERALLGLAQV